MKYTYAYKTSDGVRHEDSINASSREEVFETLRAQGIKAIKVVAADGSKANGEIRGVRKRVVAVSIVVAALAAGLIIAFLVGRVAPRPPEVPPSSVTQTPPPAEQHIVTALPRQEIQGDRKRIGKADEVFDNFKKAFPDLEAVREYVEHDAEPLDGDPTEDNAYLKLEHGRYWF